jgi:hypothetical protein
MHIKRRSGRIAQELPIVLLGTETTGKVFAEQTKTVVLSRHGAGVVSRYRFEPDGVLTLRLSGSEKEAEVRLVGQIGGEPGRYVYGVAFVDPDPQFWPIEFPPPDPYDPPNRTTTLECIICQSRQEIEQGDIEEDVYCVSGSILLHCEYCGTSTYWRKSQAKAVAGSEAVPAKPSNFSSAPPDASSSRTEAHEALDSSRASSANPNFLPPPAASPTARPPSPVLSMASPSLVAIHEPTLTELNSQGSESAGSSYSGTSVLTEFASMADLSDTPPAATATAVLQPAMQAVAAQIANPAPTQEAAESRSVDANGRPVNRRRHMRIRVNFNACIRLEKYPDEIVECENISKGGICFHSLQKYELGTMIEVASPFSPGETALFVKGQIRRVEALSGGQVFRYGVEYVKSPASA